MAYLKVAGLEAGSFNSPVVIMELGSRSEEKVRGEGGNKD